MILWIIFAGLTAAALVAVLWPFLRPPGREPDAAAYDTAVFRDQFEEIDSELARGVIGEAEADAARIEVSRRLLAAAKAGAGGMGGGPKGRAEAVPTLALVSAFIFVPVTSSALYLMYGSPGLPDRPLSARLNTSIDGQKVEALVARVEARLREHPQDGRGWEVIAPVYLRQRRFSDAADAYANVLRLLGDTPERLVDYGNAIVLAQDGVVTEAARKVLERALTGNPSLVRAHFWLAVAQEQDGNFGKAAEAWRALLGKSGPDAPWREAVQQRLAEVEQQLGSGDRGSAAAKSDAKPREGVAKGPTQDDIAAARDMSASDRTAMIRQMVSGLSERLKREGGGVDEWKRLVRSYTVLGDNDAASKALADARAAFAGKPDALASLNELAVALGL